MNKSFIDDPSQFGTVWDKHCLHMCQILLHMDISEIITKIMSLEFASENFEFHFPLWFTA